jgi:hypothetical protein
VESERIRLIGLVYEESGTWSRGSIWDINGEPKFLCSDCSIKTLKVWGEGPWVGTYDLPDEQLLEKARSEVIETPCVPEKYKDSLYTEEADWKYRLCQDALIKCEDCGKIVI